MKSSKNQNILLAALPVEEQQRLERYLTTVELETREVLIEPDQTIRHVYFPEDLVTSTIQLMDDGSSVECGLMGVEGFIGVQLWLHETSTPAATLVQIPGRARRMSAHDFVQQIRDRDTPLNGILARYVHSFLVMTSQVAACNRLHSLDMRLCRWLSMISNRIKRDVFPMSHDYMAQMLGVRRPTVSTTAKILQHAGLIDYERGLMRILDREGLRNGACECYRIIEAQVDRFAGTNWSKR
ncbi:MAG TPA: Crp/Fnr family transcriptional regulator [Terriglobales bacterium]